MESKVYHPSHYNVEGRKECWDEMVDKFGVEETRVFCKLNIYKYKYRYSHKNGEEDLRKADNYVNKYIQLGGKIEDLEF